MGVVENGYIGGLSPLDYTPLPRLPVSSQAEVAAVIDQAKAAQTEWAVQPIKERAKVLAQMGRYIMGQADQLATLLHQELGKPLTDAYAVDMGSLPELVRYYGKTRDWLPDSTVKFNSVMFPKKRGLVQRVPHGVVGLITPWNYPVNIPLHNLFPALLAGNAVVFKPSEYAARTGQQLYELISAKLPPGLVGLVQGDATAGQALISGGLDYLVFVGGKAGGQAVARAAAEHLLPVTLELGGKDAAIVLADADLERAAWGIAWAGFVNAGQSCAGVERVYVEQPVAEEFCRKLVEVAAQLRMGDDTDKPGSIEIGPLATEQQLATVQQHVEAALAAGAKLEIGGTANGRFFPPTVLTGVDANMPIIQVETFGPVVPIQVVPDAHAAIQAANASDYGLTASIWTGNLRRGQTLARQLQTGVVSINNHMFSGAAPQAVWGGTKNSGYGVQNSELAVQAFTRPKLIAIDANKVRRELWWFPYDRAMLKLARGILLTLGNGPLSRRSAAAISMTWAVMRRSIKMKRK